ncbi:MAG: restriction endonuclease subunit S [Pseudomonadota bacterium]
MSRITLDNIMAVKAGSVDPSKFRDEIFDLYSIPAFDSGQPEVVSGGSIGSSKQIVQPGDVLLSKIVPHIRRSWIVGKEQGRRIIASGEWIVFRSNQIHPGYLRHVLVGDPFHVQFMSTVSGVGGSLLRARPAHVAKIEIPLPSAHEQQRIAKILDQAEALRTKRRAALAQLDTLTKAIFFDLFTSESSIWKKVQLEEVADMVTGYPFPSAEYTEKAEAINLCRGANVLPGRIDWKDLVRWPKQKAEHLAEFNLCPGDVVIAMDRPWISEGFKIAAVRSEDCPALLVQRVARVRGKNNVPNEFLFHLLNQPSFTRHCRPTETTVPHISPKDIRSFLFPLPPLKLQREFAHHVTTIEKLKTTHRASLTELDALFASLQHRAFRGEL